MMSESAEARAKDGMAGTVETRRRKLLDSCRGSVAATSTFQTHLAYVVITAGQGQAWTRRGRGVSGASSTPRALDRRTGGCFWHQHIYLTLS